jgi:ATP adenylyltransferase/5',5'''-P-1,P-4-tetraphosphate phosphorylase II
MTNEELKAHCKAMGYTSVTSRKEGKTEDGIEQRFVTFVVSMAGKECRTKRQRDKLEKEVFKPFRVKNIDITNAEWVNETGEDKDEVLNCAFYVLTEAK